MKLLFKVLTLVAVLGLVGCSDKRKPNIELIQDMFVSPAHKAQDQSDDGPGERAMRVPPEGTKPIGYTRYTITDSQTAERELQNPVEVTDTSLLQGQKMYYTYCFVCHGLTGEGDGPVAEKMFSKPPSLVSEKIKGWRDGGIYHLITAGRGLMGSFESQIPNEEDRWALVNYVRRLQGKN